MMSISPDAIVEQSIDRAGKPPKSPLANDDALDAYPVGKGHMA
jgi:hypothetical protein